MYYIVYGLLYLLSLLPLRVLYLLSDFFCFLFFRVFKYRREVALKNLAIAFPEKTEEERIGIARDFYRNLTDTLIETIKMISVSYSFIEKRVSGDWAMVDKLYDSGRNVQIHLGHNFNWEWANSVFTKKVRYPFLVVYMPLGSKVFDRLMLEQRSRFGSVLLNAKKMHEEFLKHVNSQFVLCLAADQNPATTLNATWVKFFNQPTAFVTGPERGAKRNDAIVVFASISKPRRGYYHVDFQMVEENPKGTYHGELTKRFAIYLEEKITANPDSWLWTHRRWKHKWKEGYKLIE